LYVTAAAEDSFAPDAPVVTKPFTPAGLLAAVREQLATVAVSGG
jgi:hypothetical protein